MWWWVRTRYLIGLPGDFALAASITQRDCVSQQGASNMTRPSFIATIRLLAVPPTTCWTLGASSTSLRLPFAATTTLSLSRKRPRNRRRSTHWYGTSAGVEETEAILYWSPTESVSAATVGLAATSE